SRLPRAVADAIALKLVAFTVGDLTPWGLRRPSIGPIQQVQELGRIPLVDIGTIDLIKQGAISVVPAGIERFTSDGVRFDNGEAHPFDVVLLATGYKPRLDRFIEDADTLTDERGYPRHHGTDTARPNLYFIGYRNPITGALRDI